MQPNQNPDDADPELVEAHRKYADEVEHWLDQPGHEATPVVYDY